MNENNLEMIQSMLEEEKMVLAYFSTKDCNVCKDLYPKIQRMMEDYPKGHLVKSYLDENPALVGAFGVFTVPSIILFIEGKEYFRYGRNFSLQLVEDQLARYYGMVFHEG